MTITNREKLIELTQLDMMMDATTDAGEYGEMSERCKHLWLNMDEEVEMFFVGGKYGLRTIPSENGSPVHEIAPAFFDTINIGDWGTLAGIGRQWVCIYDVGGQQKLDVECDEARFTNVLDLLLLRDGNEWGLYHLDRQEWQVLPEYDEIVEGSGYFLLRKGMKWGYAASGVFVNALYDRIRFCRYSGFVRFYLDGQLGYIDGQGQWTQDVSCAAIWASNDGF